jgi:hypothetical protein
MVPSRLFHDAVALDAIQFPKLRKLEALAKRYVANHVPIRDSRPIALLGYPKGHRIELETRAYERHTNA